MVPFGTDGVEEFILGTNGWLLEKVLVSERLLGREPLLGIELEKPPEEIDSSVAYGCVAAPDELLQLALMAAQRPQLAPVSQLLNLRPAGLGLAQ